MSFIAAGSVADFGELSGNGGENYRTALVNNMAELAGTPKSAVSVHIIVRMCVCVAGKSVFYFENRPILKPFDSYRCISIFCIYNPDE